MRQLSNLQLFVVVILALTSLISKAEFGEECPDGCECDVTRDGKRLVCSRFPRCPPKNITTFILQAPGATAKVAFLCETWNCVTHVSVETEKLSITGNAFRGLVSTETLRLRSTHRVNFPTGSFANMNKLQSLDLSETEITLDDVTSVLIDLEHGVLEKLNLSRTNKYDNVNQITIVSNEFMYALAKLKLRTVDLSWTGSLVIPLGIDWRKVSLAHLHSFNISNTMLLVSGPVTDWSELLPFQNLEELRAENLQVNWAIDDVMNEKCSHISATMKKSALMCPNDQDISDITACRERMKLTCDYKPVPLAMTLIKLKTLNIDGTKALTGRCIEIAPRPSDGYQSGGMCFGNNTLLSFSCRRCGLSGLNLATIGLNMLEIFDFRDNIMTYISNVSLRNIPNLRALLLGGNSLGDMHVDMLAFAFVYSFNLETIDLSSNGLRNIHPLLFDSNKNLRRIDMSGNLLSSLTLKLNHLKELRILDVSGNHIIYISQSTERGLRSLYDVIGQTFLDMRKNTMDCSCESKNTIADIRSLEPSLIAFSEYQCQFEGKISNIRDISQHDLELLCVKQVLMLTLPPLFSLLFVVFLAAISYWKRAYLIKLYVRWRFFRYRRRTHPEQNRLFLAYTHVDKELVLRDIYPELNHRLQLELGVSTDVLYINDKDFQVPGLIDEEIVRGVNSTRATIVVISRSYLQSVWVNLEVTYSWIKKKPIILLLLDNIPQRDLPPVLRYFYNKRVRLLWPVTDKGDGRSAFWDNLISGLSRVLTRRNSERNTSETISV